MRSRAARVTSSAVAWIAIAGAAAFLFTSEQQLSSRRAALRVFDQQAREAAEALADVRAGQQAYVAAGQGVAFWVPKVAALVDQSTTLINTLRSAAVSDGAQQELAQALSAIAQLGNVDRRARDYIRDGEQLMAGDVVFAEGGDVATAALHQVEAARLAEARAFDADEAALRRREAGALGGAAGLTALILILLAFANGPSAYRAAPPATSTSMAASAAAASTPGPLTAGDRSLRKPLLDASVRAGAGSATTSANALSEGLPEPWFEPSVESSPASEPDSVHALRAAASVCTGFGIARHTSDLSPLLAEAGHLMNATGLIVWLGSAEGHDLRPVLAHGYPEHVLSRIPPVPRGADNAAAAAYRTGSLQIVPAKPGVSAGALVTPILGAEGCIGALTAEIRDRGETLETVQALGTIFAAQLAGLLSASATAMSAEGDHHVTVDRMASA